MGSSCRQHERKVGPALDEWLTRIEHSIKPSMAQNWRNYAKYYVIPYIGDRDVQDIDGAVCDALYAKLLAEGRIKAKPKTAPPKTTRPRAARVRERQGPAVPTVPIRRIPLLPHARRRRSAARPADRVEQANSARREDRRSQGGAASGPGTQDGRQHASDASPGVGGLRDLGLGQAQRRLRRSPAARSPQGPQGLDGQPATDLPAALAPRSVLRAVGARSDLGHAALRAGGRTRRPARPRRRNTPDRDDARRRRRQGDRVGRQDGERAAPPGARPVHPSRSQVARRNARPGAQGLRAGLPRSRCPVLLGERQASASRHDHPPIQAARQGGRPARDRPARRAPQLRDRGPQRQDRLEGADPSASATPTSRSP